MPDHDLMKKIDELSPQDLIAEGTSLASHEKIDEARAVLAKLEEHHAKNACPREYVDIVLGAVLHEEDRHKEAIACFEGSIGLLERENLLPELLYVCNVLGNTYRMLNKYEQAIHWFKHAIEGREESLGDHPLGVLYNNIGNCYARICEFDDALKYCIKALKLREKNNEQLGIASCYLNIGEIYSRMDNIDHAIEVVDKSVQIYRKAGQEIQLSKALNMMGILLKDSGRLEESIPYFTESLKYKEKHGKQHLIHNTLHALGLVHEELKDYTTARYFFERTLKLRKEIDDDESVVSSMISLARLLNLEERYTEALEMCNQIDVSSLERKDLKLGLLGVYVNSYSGIGDYENAYRYLIKLHEIKDIIYNEERLAKLDEIQTKYDLETQKREAEIYRLKNVELMEKNRQIAEQKTCIENTLSQLRRSERSLNFIQDRLHEVAGSKIIGESDEIKAVLDMVGKVALTDNTTVLIIGESGTGKELIAKAIHDASKRSKNFFHGVNSSAISATLFESELFGHEKGAFTGALTAKPGWFEVANGGTLFLDEIGTMPVEQQIKLLRVLEERNVIRVGARNQISVNVRIISATNQNLTELVHDGKFREDLYHRLAAFVIHIPPLRERVTDIPILFEHYIGFFSRAMNKTIRRVDPDVIEMLMKYPFPGNIRELKNLAEKAVILCDSSTLQKGHVSLHGSALAKPVQGSTTMNLAELEEQAIRKALEITHGNQAAAARLLGITAKAVERRLVKLGIPTRHQAG